MAAVVFYMEDNSTLVHRLEKDRTTVGRHPESDVVLTSASASGRHAEIKLSGSSYFVQDLGSSNGTRINGAEIEEAKLKDGDRVGFGDVQAIFYAGEPPSQEVIKKAAPAATAVTVAKSALPTPNTLPVEPPADAVSRAPKKKISPVRRAYNRPSSYPDTSGGGCMTAVTVIALFLIAFIVGLSLRHAKEMNGNFITDFIEKLGEKMPKVKVERKEEK
jgi:pSer/pThr/pTyr-binding forkhead associated (FHA) protein